MLSIPRKDAIKMSVPVIGDGTDGDPIRADLPYDRKDFEWSLGPGALINLRTNKPAVSVVTVYIHPSQDQAVRDHLQASHGMTAFEPSDHDRLWCEMMEKHQSGYFPDVEAIRQSMAEQPPPKDSAEAEGRKSVLCEMVRRGMPAEGAESIRAERGLPVAAKTTGTIDDDLLSAEYFFASRRLRGGGRAILEQMEADVAAGVLSRDRADALAGEVGACPAVRVER